MDIIKPSYKWKSSLDYRDRTELIVLHHAAASSCDVEDIHKWHLNNGWAGIGYHFFVDKKGNVYEGRPIGAIGAHAKGFNYNSVGICAEGDFTKETMPTVQKNAVIETIAYVKKKYPDVTIKKHKDVCSTSCPGANYPFDEIVKGKVSTSTTVKKEVKTVQVTLNVLQKGSEGEQVKTIQRLLRMLGYKDQYGNTLVIDGDFGSKTDHALRAFQKAEELEVDGSCGKLTWTALLK